MTHSTFYLHRLALLLLPFAAYLAVQGVKALYRDFKRDIRAEARIGYTDKWTGRSYGQERQS